MSGHVLNKGSYTKRNSRGVDVYFSLTVRVPDGMLDSYGTWQDLQVFPSTNASSSTSGSVGAYVSFTSGASPLEINIGISFLDVARARQNLHEELAGRAFEVVKADAVKTWQVHIQLNAILIDIQFNNNNKKSNRTLSRK
jgi:putative alpha-1,2-mannosidase